MAARHKFACAHRRLFGFAGRRILVFFVAIPVCCLGLAVSVSAALTVATYNVENYLVADRMVDGVFRKAYPKPEQEKAALVQVIASIAPDVLAVQEMGKEPFLAEFQRDLQLAGQHYPHTALLEAVDPDRHIAVLSKVPFKEVHRHGKVTTMYFGKPEAVKRGVLEVVLATDAGDLSLFVVHLKSKFTERPDDPESAIQRQQEAVAVRDLIFTRFPDPTKGRYILTGDWNDTRNSKAVRTLLKRGERELGEMLRAADSRGDTWTHFFRREDIYSRIDYLLVSPTLTGLVENGRAQVGDGPGVREASDHRPVFMRLKVKATTP
jgi:endonuclease/exonuclease/phosphatase family metal-dependent hydrolase